MDGRTPVSDVARAIGADADTMPQRERYETLAGVHMALLRRVPRRTDCSEWGGFRFEVLDVDGLRVDQVLVTRLVAREPEGSPAPQPS
jgi:CBS domain containing-hemolysin-like protein